ncbi:7768_t:CDS:2, partial [Funneliformis geosporum]
MDPNTVKRAASNLQREEQKAKGYTPAGGAAARAQSIADRAARGQTIVQDNPIEQNIDAVDAEAVNDASRMLNREESKLYGGVIPPDTAGWEDSSWGYHGDDGNTYLNNDGKSYGPKFMTGDTIGCSLNIRNNTVFYTRNGVNLGIAFRDLKTALYPCVGILSPGGT